MDREWRHALSLAIERTAFIRPVYWSRRPYHVPLELNAIHFERLDLTTLGRGAMLMMSVQMTHLYGLAEEDLAHIRYAPYTFSLVKREVKDGVMAAYWQVARSQ